MTEPDHDHGKMSAKELLLNRQVMFSLGESLRQILGDEFVVIHRHHPECPADLLSSIPTPEGTKELLLAALARLDDPSNVVISDPRNN